MLTNKANRHKNIMLRKCFLLAHVVQHVRFDPRESDVTLTLPNIEIILLCQTQPVSNQTGIVIDLINVRISEIQGQNRHTVG